MFFQCRSVRREGTEHKTFINAESWNSPQAEFALVYPSVTGGKWVATQLAGVGESPAVIRASERRGVALWLLTNLIATMATTVLQKVNRARFVARHQHGLWTDRLHDEIVRLRHFAHVADIHPGAIPDLLKLGLKDCGIGIERSVYVIGANQMRPIRLRRRIHVYLPPETSMNAPVEYDASSESNHKIAFATSSASPPRRIGTLSLTRSTRPRSP